VTGLSIMTQEVDLRSEFLNVISIGIQMNLTSDNSQISIDILLLFLHNSWV